MRQYETGFILAPNLSEEDAEAFIARMSEVVDQKKGRMIKRDVWGKRRLAYPIKKFQEGRYVFFHYEGEGDISQELERLFKQTEAVIRFLTVIKDPRDPLRKKKKTRPTEETVAASGPAATEAGDATEAEGAAEAGDAPDETKTSEESSHGQG